MTQKQIFIQVMNDGTKIFVTRWIPEKNIKGIVQLVHGMVEHTERYTRFAEILAKEGYLLSAHDMRGHGKTAEEAEKNGTGTFGFLAKKDGFNKVVNDVREVIQKAKADYPGVPVILFGHSFGSFVSQSFIEEFPLDVNACVLCGSAGPRQLMMKSGQLVVNLMMLFRGKLYRSNFIRKMTFGSYTKTIPDAKNGQEWLSRDPSVVQKFLDDPYCGFNPTLSFYNDMLQGLYKIHKMSNIKKISRALPILFIYGTDDPVGSYGKTIIKLCDIYKKIGIENLYLKSYEGARHELLNEINKEEVEKDVLAFLEKFSS